ncbi:MAG: HAMP domain-containing histidine kinase, partial [Lachnospiraceae bacterium]|nr:HAMP domain-containing histidine kinase [Lachnospiraceae bacterium]
LFTFYTHMIPLYAIFMSAWYFGLCLQGAREKGIKNYIKENCLIYRIFPFCKRRLVAMYDSLEHIDVTKKAEKTILKIVLINAVILFFISSLWFGGFAITVCYSVLLYFGLKFYVSRLQKRYSILLSKIQEISAGNLNVEIQEDLGLFEPFKEQLLLIQAGFRNAVEEEVKSQKMKSELITNVSHDLKTPLTAIITYVDLLKDDTLSREKQIEYLNTLERKSLRLKVLIEDLFEVSKATSGNVTLNYQNVDICNLIKQVELEMSDKIADAGLDVRMDFPEEKVFVVLDSQKTYRIYENLFSNIVKYSLRGTRVYVRGTLTDDYIVISLKNISAAEITVDTAELTERFVRGDASRNTEGSGLGLAIVKSFVELQGGRFMLENDGDLFKAVTSFPRKR